MHIGWSTWCAVAMWPLLRRRWQRVVVFLYPLATLFCIIVTANHYWIDGVGGLFCFASARSPGGACTAGTRTASTASTSPRDSWTHRRTPARSRPLAPDTIARDARGANEGGHHHAARRTTARGVRPDVGRARPPARRRRARRRSRRHDHVLERCVRAALRLDGGRGDRPAPRPHRPRAPARPALGGLAQGHRDGRDALRRLVARGACPPQGRRTAVDRLHGVVADRARLDRRQRRRRRAARRHRPLAATPRAARRDRRCAPSRSGRRREASRRCSSRRRS